MAVVGKDPDQQFFIKIETEKACEMLCARLKSLVTQLAGPHSQPWGQSQRSFVAGFFAVQGRLPTPVEVQEGATERRGSRTVSNKVGAGATSVGAGATSRRRRSVHSAPYGR